MKERTIYIDESLLVDPSQCDAKVRLFQRKLYIRAKQEKGFRAYSLYDKICLDYVLVESWRRVKQSHAKGTGVDRQNFSGIEEQGLHQFLTTLQKELREKTYRSQSVRRVLIPKDGKGNFRPLGIPTIKDRVVQMAVKLVMEPLWEADFVSTSYGFRPKKSAHDAIRQIKQNIYEGYKFVYDADLAKYFDTIPHDKLLILLKERVADSGILSLVMQWLRAPVEHESGIREKTRRGTPQGGVISPLLANIYLHAFDRIVSNPEGKFAKAGIRMVRYADDFVLMGRQRYSPQIIDYINRIMDNMGLRLNREKTKILHVSKSSLYFLGFEFRTIPSKFTWNKRNYTNIRPSVKSRSRLFSNISELLAKRRHWQVEPMIYKLNEVLIGWLNYFSISKVSHIWDTVKVLKVHLDYKLFKWLRSKGRKAHKSLRQRPYSHLVAYKKLLDLEKYARLKTLAKA